MTTDVYLEAADRRSPLPAWAWLVVAANLALIGLHTWLGRNEPSLPTLCTIRRLTGLPCPTCGATRMVLAAASGSWIEAVTCNPLMAVLTIAAAAYLLLQVGFKKRIVWPAASPTRRRATWAIAVALLVNWVYLLTVT